jgi:MinD-like ATPase involved in chromosome partitioning or flagellar assembly
MSKVIAIHSFRGGTGKSNITANLAAYLATKGNKVAVIDMDVQSPGIHLIFGLQSDDMDLTLNDYLMGKHTIEKVVHDLTADLNLETGQLLLIPSSMELGQISKILKEGYSVALMSSGIKQLMRTLALDFLLIDTHPGLNEETLFSFTISDILFVVFRPDKQDYQGTSITLEAARRLRAPAFLIVNNIPVSLDTEEVKAVAEETYGCQVVAAIPHFRELMEIGSSEIIYLKDSKHPFSLKIEEIGDMVMA